MNPRFEAGIPDFMNGILNFSIHFNVVHRKVDWRNPKMKSLNSMLVIVCGIDFVIKVSNSKVISEGLKQLLSLFIGRMDTQSRRKYLGH